MLCVQVSASLVTTLMTASSPACPVHWEHTSPKWDVPPASLVEVTWWPSAMVLLPSRSVRPKVWHLFSLFWVQGLYFCLVSLNNLTNLMNIGSPTSTHRLTTVCLLQSSALLDITTTPAHTAASAVRQARIRESLGRTTASPALETQPLTLMAPQTSCSARVCISVTPQTRTLKGKYSNNFGLTSK